VRRDTSGQFREVRSSQGEATVTRATLSGSFKMESKVQTLPDYSVDIAVFYEISPNEMVKQVQRGFPLKRFETLRGALGMPSEQLAAKVGMSKATFHRRQQEGKLTPDESDKLMRFGRLLVKAISVFESDEAARQWLSSPQHGLGGAVPLDYAETEVGAREVENLLGRIDHGVYS
jgi:putative toxin-antitoxin system antitoxin component (TIGR02293 family)